MESSNWKRKISRGLRTKGMPVEIYSVRRRAEFLLNNSMDATDYRRAVRAVRKLGIDPKEIPHRQS